MGKILTGARLASAGLVLTQLPGLLPAELMLLSPDHWPAPAPQRPPSLAGPALRCPHSPALCKQKDIQEFHPISPYYQLWAAAPGAWSPRRQDTCSSTNTDFRVIPENIRAKTRATSFSCSQRHFAQRKIPKSPSAHRHFVPERHTSLALPGTRGCSRASPAGGLAPQLSAGRLKSTALWGGRAAAAVCSADISRGCTETRTAKSYSSLRKHLTCREQCHPPVLKPLTYNKDAKPTATRERTQNRVSWPCVNAVEQHSEPMRTPCPSGGHGHTAMFHQDSRLLEPCLL